MDIKFNESVCSSLKPVLREVVNSEQTQEIKLSDSMPDVGRVIGAWGQCILRSKEWDMDHIQCSAGMMVWVLYAPEDGTEERMVNTWIPFQLRWDLPEGTPEGQIIVQCLTRFADARSVSPRKILIRCGVGAMARAYVPQKTRIITAQSTQDQIELLRQRYPVRIRKEAGEKAFQLDEELTLPESAPKLEKQIYCTLEPRVNETRVLADKLVFRGDMKLHLLYSSPEGQLHSWDFSLPVSQYAVLDGTYGPDAQSGLCFCVTSLEPELQENGTLRVKCGIVCQYLITDREMLDVVEDAYSLDWDTELEQESPEMDVLLDRKKEVLYPEQILNADANVVPDVRFLPDFPRLRRNGEEQYIQCQGVFQVLYCGQDRVLRSGTARWEGEQAVPMDSGGELAAVPAMPEAQATAGNGNIALTAEYPVEWEASVRQSIPMVTAIHQRHHRKPDSGRPSVIIQRAGEETLWEMAKKNGSTMEAIRKANGIQEEPTGNQMLLIPVM